MRDTGARLYCAKCDGPTLHPKQGKYDHMGHLLATVERCAVCGTESADHELPASDATSMRDADLAGIEIARLCFLRHLIARGIVAEPHQHCYKGQHGARAPYRLRGEGA